MLIRIILLLLISCNWAIAAPVNINEANADKIAQSLKGVGPSKAAAIVAFREANGPFKSIDELKYVKGIGDKTIKQNRTDILIVTRKQ